MCAGLPCWACGARPRCVQGPPCCGLSPRACEGEQTRLEPGSCPNESQVGPHLACRAAPPALITDRAEVFPGPLPSPTGPPAWPPLPFQSHLQPQGRQGRGQGPIPCDPPPVALGNPCTPNTQAHPTRPPQEPHRPGKPGKAPPPSQGSAHRQPPGLSQRPPRAQPVPQSSLPLLCCFISVTFLD